MTYAAPADWIEYTDLIADQRPLHAGSSLTVGTTTPMSGYFATDLWGVNSADLDVRALLHGYETVVWSGDMPLLNSTVVKRVSVREIPSGGCVFILEIADGLTYNDGTPVTAQDYVFSLLLEASSAVDALGGACRDLSHIPGFNAYHAGEKDEFAGVYLISPESFALEVTQDALTNFYGPELLTITPYPIDVIAPGFEIRDDGAGAYLSEGEVRGGLTTELLLRTLFDPNIGYVHNPKVSCGPYLLTDYDLDEGRATFSLNLRFAGDAWGYKPVIETLHFVLVDENGAAAKLASGEIGLMNRALNPDVVAQFRALAGILEIVYPRTGLAYLAFEAERGPGSDPDVRKAVAMALDCDELVASHPELERVYGYYGLGQWMAAELPPEALRTLEIPFDTEGANALLDTTAWCLDEDGGAYTTNGGSIRHRDCDGTLEPLTFTLARSMESGLSGDVINILRSGLEQIGAQLQIESLSFDDLLAQYYHQRAGSADMYFLASDFPTDFHPPSAQETGESGYINATSPSDEKLAAWADVMLHSGYGNRSGYLAAWLVFQSRFMELTPIIPLYSGNYYDFYLPSLTDYDVAAKGSWARAIVAAGISE